MKNNAIDNKFFLTSILDSNIDKPFYENSNASNTDFDNESGVKVYKNHITIVVTKNNRNRLFELIEKAAKFGVPIHLFYGRV